MRGPSAVGGGPRVIEVVGDLRRMLRGARTVECLERVAHSELQTLAAGEGEDVGVTGAVADAVTRPLRWRFEGRFLRTVELRERRGRVTEHWRGRLTCAEKEGEDD